MNHELLQIALNARRLPGDQPLLFRAMTACDCGCGLPDRFELVIAGMMISLGDPVQVDALIAEMQEGRRKLWGRPADPLAGFAVRELLAELVRRGVIEFSETRDLA